MLRLVCCLFVATAANAATPLFQASFEKADSSWAVVRGSATPDASVLHEGRKSLRVEPGGRRPMPAFASPPSRSPSAGAMS